LYQHAPLDVMDLLANNQSTPNYHNYGISPQNLTLSGLDKFYTNLATSIDDNGTTFVASIEAKSYPIWGSQFHPEASSSWPAAVKPGLYFAEFFVNQSKKSIFFVTLGRFLFN
jgi:gamma-glutamyl hydrolase